MSQEQMKTRITKLKADVDFQQLKICLLFNFSSGRASGSKTIAF